MSPLVVLAEFVSDVRASCGHTGAGLAETWPDLLATFRKAALLVDMEAALKEVRMPDLIPGAVYQYCDFAILVNGSVYLTRRPSNLDIAIRDFRTMAAQYPGATMLVFSQGNRDGTSIFETVLARG